ncbi:MAG: hypothetical protein HYU28_08500 [Actinobacteria bacterium]|nr:hypothetical protein [Actinomycetota bacterium]
MVVVIAIAAAVVLLVIAVAAVATLRESARMDREPPTRWFNVSDAVEWVVEHIADDAAATLTLDDVHRIVDLQLEYFRRKGVSRNGETSRPRGDVVVGGSETVAFIVRESAKQGVTFTNEQVHAVVETQLAYLRSIGVVGARAEEGPAPEDERDAP